MSSAIPPAVPASELELDFIRSSGPGGQNVNKTSTKVQLRWSVGASAAFTDEQKALIRRRAGKRLNADDQIVLWADTERSQSRNREAVVGRLQALVADALAPVKERRPTRPSRAARRRRLEDKRRQSEKKRSRKGPAGGW